MTSKNGKENYKITAHITGKGIAAPKQNPLANDNRNRVVLPLKRRNVEKAQTKITSEGTLYAYLDILLILILVI